MSKLKVILTGATGMVGESVLYECLHNDDVEKVVTISRKPCGYSHPKLEEIIHDNLFDISSLSNRLIDFNTCFFCIGVSALGKNETEYSKYTYTLTIGFATTLASFNHDMTFCYISGTGTDSSEKGKVMWARVKGKTENDLMKLPFKKVYNFRPGGLIPFLPLKKSQTYYNTYKYFGWLFHVLKIVMPGYITPLKEFALAMIKVATNGYDKNILEVKDINSI